MPPGLYGDSCEGAPVSHRGTGHLLNRVATKSSAHQATVEVQLHGRAVGSSKRTLVVTSLLHKKVKGQIVIQPSHLFTPAQMAVSVGNSQKVTI